MNSKCFILLYVLSSIVRLCGSEPAINPLLMKSVIEEKKDYAQECDLDASKIKIIFQDRDISNATQTFYELGVRRYSELKFITDIDRKKLIVFHVPECYVLSLLIDSSGN